MDVMVVQTTVANDGLAIAPPKMDKIVESVLHLLASIVIVKAGAALVAAVERGVHTTMFAKMEIPEEIIQRVICNVCPYAMNGDNDIGGGDASEALVGNHAIVGVGCGV